MNIFRAQTRELNHYYSYLNTNKVVEALVNGGITSDAIGIITPYNSQASLIHQVVGSFIEIHTIDKYQVLLETYSCNFLSNTCFWELSSFVQFWLMIGKRQRMHHSFFCEIF